MIETDQFKFIINPHCHAFRKITVKCFLFKFFFKKL